MKFIAHKVDFFFIFQIIQAPILMFFLKQHQYRKLLVFALRFNILFTRSLFTRQKKWKQLRFSTTYLVNRTEVITFCTCKRVII